MFVRNEFVAVLHQKKRIPAVIRWFGPFGHVAIRTPDRVNMDVPAGHLRKSTIDENRVIFMALKTDPECTLAYGQRRNNGNDY